MCCSCCSVRQQKIWLFAIASLLTILGIVLITVWPDWSRRYIQSRIPLSPDSYSFRQWDITPIPLYTIFYLYNWTNADEWNNTNVKPHFTEHGPYAFRETKVKEDINWHSDNNTVTFFGRRTWVFDAQKSNGSLEDLIIAPNILVVTASRLTRNLSRVLRKIVNFALNREGGALTLQHTAIEWIFDGFYDDLFDFVERLHSPLLPVDSNNFAYFYARNNSKDAEGTFTIHTGKGDLKQMGNLKLWNGTSNTGLWEGECGKVNGSTGELWAPTKNWHDPVSIFLPDAARFINVFPQENLTVRGVKAWRYSSTDQTFDNGYVAPDTKCFCVRNRECPRNGVIDYSPVAKRAPMYMSHPHFYMTDAYYRENTTGLQPDPTKHGIDVLMEPMFGVPIDINGKVLLSLHVQRDEAIDFLKDVAFDFYAPMFVIQIKAEMTDDILNFVKFAMLVPQLGQYIGIALTVVGVIMIAVGIWLTMAHKWRGKQDAQNVDKEHRAGKELSKQTQ